MTEMFTATGKTVPCIICGVEIGQIKEVPLEEQNKCTECSNEGF